MNTPVQARPLAFLLVALLAASACGSDDTTSGQGGSGASTTATGSGGSGGEAPVCATLPQHGDPCATEGEQCIFPGSPCGGTATCTGGSWSVETSCPQDECPDMVPGDGAPCSLVNPAAGPLSCQYPCPDGANELTATCDDTSWFIAPCPGGSGSGGM
jgi:hypothetical protein